MRPDFRQKLETFVEGCKRIRTEFYAANGFKEEGACMAKALGTN
jgi:hypothetical protein